MFLLLYNKLLITNMGNKSTKSKKANETKVIAVRVPVSVHKQITDMIVDKYQRTGKLDQISETTLPLIEKGLELFSPAKSA
jgi:hypothetical protein